MIDPPVGLDANARCPGEIQHFYINAGFQNSGAELEPTVGGTKVAVSMSNLLDVDSPFLPRNHGPGLVSIDRIFLSAHQKFQPGPILCGAG